MLETNQILNGDCIEELKKLPDNSIDAIITDPPYGLEFMGKDWDKFKNAENIGGGTMGNRNTPYQRGDKTPPAYCIWTLEQKNEFQIFSMNWAKECLRVLKPGGYLLSFGGTRTYHRMACGIEDAGFEIRDCIMWIYGSGFPKSLNIGKAVDKLQGNEREVVFKNPYADGHIRKATGNISDANDNVKFLSEYKLENGLRKETKGTSEWEGWGTALKPAVEPIVVARKPLSEKNVALNVLKWGTGGINIDECRISHNEPYKETNRKDTSGYKEFAKNCGSSSGLNPTNIASPSLLGRFPANIILDEEAGEMLDKQTGNIGCSSDREKYKGRNYGESMFLGDKPLFNSPTYTDKGGASRFFYVAKASKSERNFGCEGKEEIVDCDRNPECYSADVPFNRSANPKKNNHPTVKPIKLMEYLIKLVTKENAVVLDPFLGSGTTAIACLKTNRKFIGIEKESDYVKIAEARIKPYLKQIQLNSEEAVLETII